MQRDDLIVEITLYNIKFLGSLSEWTFRTRLVSKFCHRGEKEKKTRKDKFSESQFAQVDWTELQLNLAWYPGTILEWPT